MVGAAEILVIHRVVTRDLEVLWTSKNLGAIQSYTLHGDQALRTQHAQYLHKQIVQDCLGVRTKTGRNPMTDRLKTAEPLETRVKFATPCQFASELTPQTVDGQPQADQQLRRCVVAPADPATALTSA
jgi:hypothetical protein